FRRLLEIVERTTGSDLLGLEGHVEVVVEVAVIGGDPGKAPAHPFAHDLNLVDGRARNYNIGDIVVVKMLEQAVDVIDLERTPDALMRNTWPHHEMFDEELAATVEERRQRDFPVWRIEHIFFLDPDPGQRASRGAQIIAQLRQLFFACE